MSYTKVTFVGLNLSRLLTTLCKNGLQILSVDKYGQTCSVTVKYADKKRLLDVLADKCYNVVDVQDFGAVAHLSFAKRHFVLLLAIVVMVVSCGVLSNYCCKIVVSGAVPTYVVLEQLQSLGVTIGTNLAKVNVDHLENALATKLDVMYAVVTRKASVLYVETIAKKHIDPPIDMHQRRDIIATSDGIVESIFCEQGTPVVKVGDAVHKGDVLIVGTRLFNDDTTEDVYALGKVVVVKSVSGFAPYTGTKTQLEPTGNGQTVTRVVLFGKSYGKSCNYTHYQTDVKTTFLHPLNLQIQTITYYEMAFVTVQATLEDCLQELTQQSLKLALEKCDFVVTNTQFVTNADGVCAILQGREIIS